MTTAKEHPETTIEIKSELDEETEKAYRAQLAEDAKLRPGEIISCDDVPVSPVSLDGFNTFFTFRDTKTQICSPSTRLIREKTLTSHA